jgi:tetratricopeptide (TPR) repeat protein
MSDPVELPDVDLEEARSDRFARAIAICAVLATLVGACVGYLESVASKAADRADVEAQQLAVAASNRLAYDREQAQVQYGLLIERQVQLREASSALEELRFGNGASGRVDALRLERARNEKLAETTARTAERIADEGGAPVLDPSGPDGPSSDGTFPSRYFTKSRAEGLRLTALRDAANEESAQRSSQVASFVVVLAMLAVAVYLFGFSLTPHGRPNRRLFGTVAAGLAAVATVWAIFVAAQAPERAPPEAASAYASGRVLAELGDDAEAVEELSRAVELRPTFARAYQLRGSATFVAASPQTTGPYSVTTPEALALAAADLRKARDLGQTDVRLTSTLGAITFHLGLAEDDEELFEESLGYSREAMHDAPDNPIYTFNAAVAQLATGDSSGARDTYREGVEAILGKADPALQDAYLASALTPLDAAREKLGDEAAEDIDELKRFLVASVAAGRVIEEPEGPERELSGLEVTMTPALASVDIPRGQIEPGADVISLQWYQRQGDLGWSVLSEISGAVDNDEIGTDPADGSTFVNRSYLAATGPPACLHATDYRVEAYVNGRLAGVARSDPSDELGELEPSMDLDIGVAVCHPKGWRPVANPLPGLVNAYVDEGSARGIYVARVGAGVDGAGTAQARALRKVRSVVGLLFSDDEPRLAGADEFPGFLGLEGGQVRRFTFNGGRGVLLAGFGFDVRGALFAAVVFGDPAYMRSTEAFEVLNSVVER